MRTVTYQLVRGASGLAANQTNVHKKMDKILQKLAALEDTDKALMKQTN